MTSSADIRPPVATNQLLAAGKCGPWVSSQEFYIQICAKKWEPLPTHESPRSVEPRLKNWFVVAAGGGGEGLAADKPCTALCGSIVRSRQKIPVGTQKPAQKRANCLSGWDTLGWNGQWTRSTKNVFKKLTGLKVCKTKSRTFILFYVYNIHYGRKAPKNFSKSWLMNVSGLSVTN
jgi:hypothetical protein